MAVMLSQIWQEGADLLAAVRTIAQVYPICNY
jgi:hypothetical protein